MILRYPKRSPLKGKLFENKKILLPDFAMIRCYDLEEKRGFDLPIMQMTEE